MIRFNYFILVLLFLELQTDLASANPSKQDVSAILKSYADAYTTDKPEESQYVTQIYPKIEVQNRGFVYDFTKVKHDNRPAPSNAPLHTASSNSEPTSVGDYSGSSSVEESVESVDPKGPADHVIPFSEHENPKEPSTRPNYTAPGDWAKPPADKNIPLEFVPTKLYAQVRDSHTVKHVPREEAAKSAETSEEKENAARLKEVVKESKANTVYTEEGYEDAAYDHAGQIRDADFHEDFKRKLNEELNSKESYSGRNKRPKTFRKHKPRRYRENKRDDFAESFRTQTEVAEEARTSKQITAPEHLSILKSALNQQAMDPKNAVESGIIALEKDLKDESYEMQLTSTEPYTYETTTVPITFKPLPTDSAFQSKMDLETTTLRRNVFTIRPKKTFITVRPKIYDNKPKKILKTFTISNNLDNRNAYSTNSYSYEPTTVDYGNSVWRYLLQNQNATPPITYPPPYFEQQTVNPVIANPLAVATVNGHGPYLVVVPASPNTYTPIPLESENFESTIGYPAVHDYNLTKSIVADSYGSKNPFIPINRKTNDYSSEQHYNSKPQTIFSSTEDDDPVYYRKGKIKHRDKKTKLEKLKSQPLSEVDPNYTQTAKANYMEYYTVMQPPKSNKAPITYSDYKRKPYTNVYDQWPETDESGKVVESDESHGIERPLVKPALQKNPVPVTKLLPPAPLSASEYATFQRQSKEVKLISPSVMEMMPIIGAIHKHEQEQSSFPYLFRRKRSTFGFFRSPNFKLRDRRHQGIDGNSSYSSSYPSKDNNTKYPANFQFLLNESPHVAAKVVEDEINGRFGNDTKTFSDESSSGSSDRENSKKSKVEVEVPELDFSSAFEKDEAEPATEKPRVDTKKYPFYKDSSVLRNTALKYVVNPKEVPKKTLGGMEFYNSRIRECEEVDPNLEKIVPEDDKLVNKIGPQKKMLRLHGLGDKIDCYKAKYFDENPFDNPLFFEKGVEMPAPPVELNPKKIASRILELPVEKDEYTISKGPKNPEFVNVKRASKLRRPLKQHVPERNIRYHMYPKLRKPSILSVSHQRYRYPTKYPTSIEDKIRPHEAGSKVKIKSSNLKVVPRYQRLVYEDVMGNIMNSEKLQKSHVPKRGVIPLYSKYYKRDNSRKQGNTVSKKSKTVVIDGLVPPAKKIHDKLIYSNSNLKHNKIRYNSSDVLTKNIRIYKRSITLIDNKNLSLNDTGDENKKSTFRIVFTTPSPKEASSDKPKLDSGKVNDSEEKNISHTVYNSPKHLHRSDADPGRYDKFSTRKKINETRRKEPKYNVPKKSESSKFFRDTTVSSSTFLPVMMNLYDNFTARIPRGSINNHAKQQIAGKPNYNKRSDRSYLHKDIIKHSAEEENDEDPNKQFVTFSPVREKSKNKSSGDDVETVYISTPNVEQHKELFDFLKGNPPGYDEAFTEEIVKVKPKKPFKEEYENSNTHESPKNEEIQVEPLETQEPSKNEDTDDEISEAESENSERDEPKKETFEEEGATDDSQEEVEENVQPDEDEEKSKNDEAPDEPFVRFSSRPYSPSENYEDEQYADLGPRVNKPYFYHPPFDVPTYEKYALGQTVDHSGDDYGHEEAEDPEKYVFPWENDKEESEHHPEYRHEYPWEKRERQQRERQKREKMHKGKNKKNVDSASYSFDDYGEEASSTKFMYIPSKNRHLRGKKDVNAAHGNSNNFSPKYSSKYKSSKIRDFEDDKNSDDFGKSILEFIENIEISTPEDENIYTTPRTNKEDISSEKVASDTVNKYNDTIALNSNTEKSLTTLKTPKVESFGKMIATTVPPVSRSRGKSRRIDVNNITKSSDNISVSLPADLSHFRKAQLTLPSKMNRQRGRHRNSVIASGSTTTTTAKPNIRRRTRLASTTTTTSTTTQTAPEPQNGRRRRPFRIISYTDSNAVSSTPSTIQTSTGRTVEREHRSRVSKEMIITKTVEDNDDIDEDSNKNTSNQHSKKSPSKVAEIRRSKIKHQQKAQNISDDENPPKKERVEKVTITMEETPDHVYKTKEVDKDGVKGKFITITANNNSAAAAPIKRNRDHTAGVDDAEMEEMKRRMEAFKSFDSVIQDTQDMADEPSSLRQAEKYVVSSLLQKLPLPSSRKFTRGKEDSTATNNSNESEEEDDSSDGDDDDDDDSEGTDNDDDESDSEDPTEKKNNGETYGNNNKNSTNGNPSVIKNPDHRKYYYVETR